MKKELKKKIKDSSNAIRYFSTETLTRTITVVISSCQLVDETKTCSC